MPPVKLQIKRKSSFVGMAMSYKILINGIERCRLRNGNETIIEIPSEQCVLEVSMAGNSLTFHKISKEIVLFPQNSKQRHIICEIVTSPKWTGVITSGLFAPVGTIDLRVNYLNGASGNYAQSQAINSTPNKPQATQEGRKFCTACGTPNPQTAKFCSNCGKPM